MNRYTNYHPKNPNTICALATSPGMSAIAIVRVSGPDSFPIAKKVFSPRNKSFDMEKGESHKLYCG